MCVRKHYLIDEIELARFQCDEGLTSNRAPALVIRA